MFELGFSEFIRNIKKNIFVIIQLCILYIVTIFMVSTILEQMRLYNGIKGFVDDTGIIIYSDKTFDESKEALDIQNIDIKKELVKVERVEYPLMYGEIGREAILKMVVYNPEYRMKLVSGKDCYSTKPKEGYIRAMSCKSSGIKKGQTYECYGYKFYITGLYDADEMVYGYSRIKGTDSDYKLFYDTYRNIYGKGNEKNQLLFVVNYEDAVRENAGFFNGIIAIDYEDDITDEQISKNQEILNDKYGLFYNSNYINSENVYNNTKKVMKLKLTPLVIAFVIVFVYSLFSLITSSAISFSYEQRNYGIYFLTGNTWKNTILLTIVHWGIAIGSSLFIAVCLSLILGKTGILSDFNLEFSLIQIGVIAGIIVIQLLMALIIPWRMLRKTEPVTIIKESER